MIRFVNRQTELLFGYDRGELVGQPIETLVPESFREVHTAHREGYIADPGDSGPGRGSGAERTATGWHRVPGGHQLVPIDTEDGLLVIAAVRDMTDRKKAEADRRRSDRMAAIVEYSDDAIISSTLDGIITSWNPAAERMYGYSSEEIIGKSMGLTIARDRAGESSAILARIRRRPACRAP